ncbi:hypothetical protein THRCLA_02605 [Thraustotheca clavata]|uniref:Calcineurin-like phosphoesterase domain-containing protein n=1 Tax=Thraustotheca clavata TaxID=74557 RepID=A0A1W0A4K7_9STRA|nr:hypothetical protein THRCLA_02605 [Thraustotheca clavata]
MSTPLFSFGAIADVQYADIDDAWNYMKTSRRYYRQALSNLQSAVDSWIDEAKSKPLRFVMNLGDLLDGKNAATSISMKALLQLRGSLDAFQSQIGPVHHCIGNHELYNFNREEYLRLLVHHTSNGPKELLPPPASTRAYYSFHLPQEPSFLFIVLDPYEKSIIGNTPGSVEHTASRNFIAQRNPNNDLNSSASLLGVERRFVEYNGAIDTDQLSWLRETLDRAQARQQHVVVFSHVPIHPDSCHHACLLWNYDTMLQTFASYNCIRAVFCGHYHENGYAVDAGGIHYVVFHAALESKDNAFATIDVYADHLDVRGRGNIPSRILAFKSN